MKRTAIVAAMIVAWACIDAGAYELRTHAAVTKEAIQRSKLFQDANLASELGLQLDEDDTLGSEFFERTPGGLFTRRQHEFELGNSGGGVTRGSLRSWLVAGALREDDLTRNGCLVGNSSSLLIHRTAGECNPQESHPNVDRVVNHFLDPQNGFRPLTPPPPNENPQNAVNWAVGTSNAFENVVAPSSSRGNFFSLVDARNAMYYALSGKGPQGEGASSEATRKAWWATTLRSLGDASHLVQDMAQPQHTKNELEFPRFSGQTS